MADVAILGDGIPELAAALELAEVGLRVRVYPHRVVESEAAGADPLGDAHASDSRGLLDPEGELREFLARVAAPLTEDAAGAFALAERVVPRETPPSAPLLRAASGAWAPQPQPAVVGIPAVPLSSDALALLGGRAALRAAVDRIRPVLTIGKAQSFGALVRSRLGRGALERLVEPLSREAYGVASDEIDVAVIAPGLNEALTRAGALSGAALDLAERRVARETSVAPAGGWAALRQALAARLRLYRVEFADAPAAAVTQSGEVWHVDAGPEGAGRVEARALVRGIPEDAGEEAERAWSVGALAPLVGQLRRVRGQIPIAPPELPARQPEGPAVATVTVGNGELWSVRLQRSESAAGTGWEALVTGETVSVPPRTSGEWLVHAAERIAEAVAAAGQRPAGEASSISMPFAPYATVAAREAARQRLAEWAEAHPDELPAGVGLHGGELGRAVADARERAVTLRRRLAGIAD